MLVCFVGGFGLGFGFVLWFGVFVQCIYQVDDFGFFFRVFGQCFVGVFGFDQFCYCCFVVVFEVGGIEFVYFGFDDVLGQIQYFGVDFDFVDVVECIGGGLYFIIEIQCGCDYVCIMCLD